MVVAFLARVGRTWPVLLLVLVLPACDPCAGVLSCGDPEIAYRGTLLMRHSGAPVVDARVEFVASGGVGLTEPAVARTDSAGIFVLEGATESRGQVSGVVRIYYSDGMLVDSIPGLVLSATRGGDSHNLGPIPIAWPHIDAFGNLFQRATRKPAAGVEVEFRRTGGVAIDPDTFVVKTDAAGNFPLRPSLAGTFGEVVGDLIIRPGGGARADTVRGLRLAATLRNDPSANVLHRGIGPHIPFIGRVVWGDNGAPAAGVQVEVKRVGGIEVEPAQYTVVANALGLFSLTGVPAAAGEVKYEITFRSTTPALSVVYPYTVRTLEDDRVDLLVDTWVLPPR